MFRAGQQGIDGAGYVPIALMGASPKARNGLLNDLIAYWPGDEAAGNLLDLHTNALTMTDNNTVTSAVGKVYPTARQYTAATFEYHSRASEALLQTGNINWTVAAWVYANTFPALAGMFGKDGGNREHSLIYEAGALRFRFRVYNGAALLAGLVSADSLGVPSTGVWYLVVASHNATLSRCEISVNGGTVDTSADILAPGTSAAGLTIGKYNTDGDPARQWDGRIGPTAFWKTVLTDLQRAQLYNGGSGLKYTDFTT